MFAGFYRTRRDDLHGAGGEERWISVGVLDDVVVIVGWTLRPDPEAIAWFERGGRGWRSRVNEALKTAAGL